MPDDIIEQEILAVNNRFYEALAQASIEKMTKVWHHSPEAECIHPGWDRLIGWTMIQESWDLIFQHQGPIPVEATDAIVRQKGDMAWVTCYEHLTTQSTNSLEINQAVATNIFIRVDGVWRMVIHHAAAAPPSLSRTRRWGMSLN